MHWRRSTVGVPSRKYTDVFEIDVKLTIYRIENIVLTLFFPRSSNLCDIILPSGLESSDRVEYVRFAPNILKCQLQVIFHGTDLSFHYYYLHCSCWKKWLIGVIWRRVQHIVVLVVIWIKLLLMLNLTVHHSKTLQKILQRLREKI